jgi:hypothetical protein
MSYAPTDPTNSTESSDGKYNINRYSISELRHIVGVDAGNSKYTIQQKLKPFFVSSANNQKMFRFFRQVQHVLLFSKDGQDDDDDGQDDQDDDDGQDDQDDQDDDGQDDQDDGQDDDDDGQDDDDDGQDDDGQDGQDGQDNDDDQDGQDGQDGHSNMTNAVGLLIQNPRNNNQMNTNPNNHNPNSNSMLLANPLTGVAGNATPLTRTVNHPYPSGVLNPIETRIVTKIITIDSMFRTNYNNTNSNTFQWELLSPEKNVVSMKIAAVELPVMWYDITDNARRNEITITIFNCKQYNDETQTHLLKVPPGNYNPSDMETTMNTLFQNKKGGLEYLKFIIDPNTTLTTIRAIDTFDDTAEIIHPKVYGTLPDNDHLSPEFYFTTDFYIPPDTYVDHACSNAQPTVDTGDQVLQRHIGWYFGFRQRTYTAKKINTVTTLLHPEKAEHTHEAVLTSESSFGGGRNHYIYIAVDDFNRNCMVDTISDHAGGVFVGNNLLGRISVTVPVQDILVNTLVGRLFKTREYLGPVTLSNFKISLTDKFGEKLDLKNNDFSLALELSVLY